MKTEIEVGSTNVYADLGYADAAEMQRKSDLAMEVARVATSHPNFEAMTRLLGIDALEISKIAQGNFRDISESRLAEIVAGLKQA